MKIFKDLQFESHPVGDGLMARMYFENGYGISVVRFKTLFSSYGSYTRNESQWEIAVLKGTEDNNELCYDSPITDDVIGYLSKNDVSEIMERIQLLPQVCPDCHGTGEVEKTIYKGEEGMKIEMDVPTVCHCQTDKE